MSSTNEVIEIYKKPVLLDVRIHPTLLARLVDGSDLTRTEDAELTLDDIAEKSNFYEFSDCMKRFKECKISEKNFNQFILNNPIHYEKYLKYEKEREQINTAIIEEKRKFRARLMKYEEQLKKTTASSVAIHKSDIEILIDCYNDSNE
jgi:hypothetical protein